MAGITGSAFALSAPAAPPKPVLPPDPPLPKSCTATRLPSGGAAAGVTGGDPSGTYLVGGTNTDYSAKPQTHSVLVWRDGKLVADVPKISQEVVMSDINASGVAVGSTEGQQPSYVYRDGKVSRLAGSAAAQVINDAGMIAGSVGDRRTGILNAEVGQLPMRWADPDAQPEAMKLPPGTTAGKVAGITEDGTIIVDINTSTYIAQTYLWFPDGTSRAIKTPELGHGETTRFMSVYLRSGWVYGQMVIIEPHGFPMPDPSADHAGADYLHTGNYVYRAAPYRYHLASGTFQQLPDNSPVINSGMQALIGNRVYTYPTPTPVIAGTDDVFTITAVSDDGHTAGGSYDTQRPGPNNLPGAFRWLCK